jgi:hypothetical protein
MGVIVAVGHTVGMVYEPFQNPGQAVIHDDFTAGEGEAHHDKLIGAVVTFNAFVGQSLEDDYDGDWLEIMAMDILGHNRDAKWPKEIEVPEEPVEWKERYN